MRSILSNMHKDCLRSNFNRVSDYLPILNAALVVDLAFIFLTFNGVISSAILQKWYKKYHSQKQLLSLLLRISQIRLPNTFGSRMLLELSAVLADILILVIGVLITRFLYPLVFSGEFTGLAVFVQVIHDILFYLFFSRVPVGYINLHG